MGSKDRKMDSWLKKDTESSSKRDDSEQSGYRFGWFDWFCLWYPPGWLILFNRHWQHYHTDPQGWNWLEYALFLIPGGFYLALLLRWLRLKCRVPQATEQPIDPNYQTAFREEILTPILKHYFRAELHQTEHLPRSGGVIVAMNHAGMCFPWDMVGLGVLLNQAQGWVARPLAHEIFFDHAWVRWWLPAGWSQVLGGIRANATSFATALQSYTKSQDVRSQDSNTIVLYAPEGWRGLSKGWQHRYQLAKFDPSFVHLSYCYQVPVLPIVCMGNENLHPWTINVKKLARWVGLPMFPISPFLIAFILFPSMGVWANRTRLRYYIQPMEEPGLEQLQQQTDQQLKKQSNNAPIDRASAYRIAQILRSNLQSHITKYRSSQTL